MTQFDIEKNGPNGVEGYYEYLGDSLHIHFYGTDHPEDIKTDLKFWKKTITYKTIKVRGLHEGFAQYALTALPFVETLITPEVKYVHVTGHSLGAAIATIVGFVLFKLNIPVSTEVYGSPRVGGLWLKFATRRMKLRRIEIQGDPIVHIPPIFFGFIHSGVRTEYVWIGEDTIKSLYDRHQPGIYQKYTEWRL